MVPWLILLQSPLEHLLDNVVKKRVKRQLACANGFQQPGSPVCTCFGTNQWTGPLCDIGEAVFIYFILFSSTVATKTSAGAGKKLPVNAAN